MEREGESWWIMHWLDIAEAVKGGRNFDSQFPETIGTSVEAQMMSKQSL